MILLLWFYISGLVILVGAEMNAEIEHASPYGKEEGEKVPGEKRTIGPARMRAWLARQRKGGKPPSAKEIKEVVENSSPPPNPRPAHPPAAAAAPAGGFSDYVIGLGVVITQMVM